MCKGKKKTLSGSVTDGSKLRFILMVFNEDRFWYPCILILKQIHHDE